MSMVTSFCILHIRRKSLTGCRRTGLPRIRREKVQPQAMALRVVPQLLYGKGHPYSLPFTGSGTEASVSKLTREDLAKWHDDMVQAQQRNAC